MSAQELPEDYESPECEPAVLRDDETPDEEMGHAARNLENIRLGVERGDLDPEYLEESG